MLYSRIGHRYKDSTSNKTLDTWYPASNTQKRRACLAEKVGMIKSDFVETTIDSLDDAPLSTEDAYLRLHLLSLRIVKPNQLNLEGIFALLPNIAWTSAGPVFPEHVETLKDLLAAEYHHLMVHSIDKFPRMSDYVIPDGVRIADAERVRLGAYLAGGTTVMHEGFINFNAGTLGESMVEGRITQGVVVGKQSDVGAGASIMGTLSGGGKIKNSMGERSLLGANAGIGIALGDECIVEAGLYVTAGTKVRLSDGTVVQARTLSGKSGLLYRRNSQAGYVEAISTDASRWGGLNSALHGAPKTD